jgi:hypothetical protein
MSTMLVVALMVGMAALPALFQQGLRLTDRRDLLREVARARGLQLVWTRGGPRVVGQQGGLPVELRALPDGVRVVLEVGLGAPLRVLRAQQLPDRLLTGDAAFDAVVAVVGEPPACTLARLDAPSRERLRVAVERHAARCGQGYWTLQCRPQLEEVLLCLELAEALARWIRPLEGELTARLLALAERDPVPGVRLQALQHALPHLSPSDPRLVALGEDPDPAVAFHAAAARGADGHGQILRLLAHDDPLVSEATALSLIERAGGQALPWLEDKLVQLCAIRPTERLIGALGEVGSARSLPTLRALVGRGLGLGARAAAARRALQRVEGRLSGERGGLSLAPDGGAVSLAPAEGQLSPASRKFDGSL